MKKKIWLLSLFTLSLQFATAQTSGKLIVRVENIEDRLSGDIYICLFDDEKNFPGDLQKATHYIKISDFQQDCSHTFTDLAYGEYAVMVFQDKNSNGTLDRNIVGYPKEPLGLSNMNRIGRPSFSKNKISFSKSGQVVRIPLLNQ
jgi:uncharacterized protein (DUF2141 family)